MNKQALNTITLTLAVHAINQADPTRTAMLVRSLERQLMLRFARIKQAIRKAIVEQDVFGLKPAVYADIPGKKAFAFTRTDDKVLAFMDWLREQTNKDLLQLGFMSQSGQAINQAWMNTYIEDSYKRGMQRARYELKKAGYDVPTLEATGGIGASLATPFHADRLGVLYTRAFNELKGITENMNTQISRVLTEGMMNGDGPAVIARKLQAVISGGGADLGITDSLGRFIPAERRARMLARTEMIRAHHMATIQEYKNWGLEGVKVKAEWSTAGDGRVCEKCASLEGKVYDLNVIEGMIPAHPNCRCLALPTMPEDGVEKGQKIPKENAGFDMVAKGFINPEDGAQYMEYKKGYEKDIKALLNTAKKNNQLQPFLDAVNITNHNANGAMYTDFGVAIKNKLMDDCPDVMEALHRWQASTHNVEPSSLKVLSHRLEKKAAKELIIKTERHTLEEMVEYIEQNNLKDQYLRFRAFNQAYMKIVRSDLFKSGKILLHRGTSGKTGKFIKNTLLRDNATVMRKSYNIKDANLVGYTTIESVAHEFGTVIGGVTVIGAPINISDIFCCRDLLCGMTNGYAIEAEYILIGYVRNFLTSLIQY